jgi:anti-sigma regulatory factor (Ser/Thr protein kinase)
VTAAVGLCREVTLPGLPESVGQFRALVRELAATEYQAEAGSLCVSELVTNAILHTRSGLPGGTVTVSIGPADLPGELRISVCDNGPGRFRPWAPPLPDAPDVPEHGYGLGIVDVVAADWGVVPAAGGGSRIWCDIPELAS